MLVYIIALNNMNTINTNIYIHHMFWSFRETIGHTHTHTISAKWQEQIIKNFYEKKLENQYHSLSFSGSTIAISDTVCTGVVINFYTQKLVTRRDKSPADWLKRLNIIEIFLLTLKNGLNGHPMLSYDFPFFCELRSGDDYYYICLIFVNFLAKTIHKERKKERKKEWVANP